MHTSLIKLINKYLFLLPIVLMAAIFLLNLHNLALFPLNRGFDADGHLEYISYIRKNLRIPLANEGWELYQTPLYYLINSIIGNPYLIRYFNLGFWSLFLVLSTIFFTKLFKDRLTGLIGAFFASSLPVVIYLLPTVSNELFSGIMISLTIMYYGNGSKKNQIILGILMGLSLLSKATAFVLAISIITDQLLRNKLKINKTINKLIIPLAIALAISGWFYIRNAIYFGNPFVTSVDFTKYSIHQSPGYRDLNFFVDFSGFIKFDLFRAHHYSLIPGTFFSWFFDGHNVIIPVQPYSKAGILLIISSLPIVLVIVRGILFELKDRKNNIFFIYPIILFLSYIAYNFKLPFYSTVKGAFLVSGVIPFTYFFLKGLVNSRKYFIITNIYLVFYAILILRNFWILESWYK